MKHEGGTRETCLMTDGDVYYGIESLFLGMDNRKLNLDHMKNFKECLRFVSAVNKPPNEAIVLFDFCCIGS